MKSLVRTAISLSLLLMTPAVTTKAARAQSAPPVIERFKGHAIPPIPATDRAGHPVRLVDLHGRVPRAIEWDKREIEALIARSVASR